MAAAQKTGRQASPQDRMDNNMMENIKSSLQQSNERTDLSKMAQDYLDQQAGKPTSYQSQGVQDSPQAYRDKAAKGNRDGTLNYNKPQAYK